MKTRVFFLLLVMVLPLLVWAQPAENPQTFCNPLNLNYRFMSDAEDAREAADALVVLYKDDYYLFASRSGGYWTSPDMKEWSFIKPTGLNVEGYAPTAIVMRDTLFYTHGWGSTAPFIYKTTDPKSGEWTQGPEIPTYGDPNLFYDDDGRLYMYDGLSNTLTEAIGHVVELDPITFEEIGESVDIFYSNAAEHGWERRGDDNLLDEQPWLEGLWVVKENGKYYVHYAGPGTEYKTYGDGIYVSDSPMGPFEYAPYSPFAFKPTGFISGAGHGATFKDKNDQYWHIGNMTISVDHMFERRLGMWPVDFDEDGQIYCNTSFGDFPQYLQNDQGKLADNSFAGMLVLSRNKQVFASTVLDSYTADLAVDEEVRTQWSASSGNEGEWLMVDLGKEASVEAIQVNFAEMNTSTALVRGRDVQLYQQYIIETSVDGKVFEMLVDKSDNLKDVPNDYVELESPKTARYVKITNIYTPGDGFFALGDFRVFGNSEQATFTVASGLTVDRDEVDGRDATISWSPVEGADGYVVRYGIAPDKLYNNYMVYDVETLTIHSLNRGVDYYFEVEAFDSGLESYKPTGELRSKQSGDWNDLNTWEQFDGQNWVQPVDHLPMIGGGAVTIMEGHVITVAESDSVQQLHIQPNGELVVNEGVQLKVKNGVAVDLVAEGTVTNFGSIISETGAEISFTNSGRYVHKQNGGAVPTATWRAQSTCVFDSIVDTLPTNCDQDYFSIEWNCPAQTMDMSLGMNGNTIGGNINILDTGDGILTLCDPAGGDALVSINGNIMQTGGIFSINKNDGDTEILVMQKGSINVTGGAFGVTCGDQGATGKTLWLSSGDTVSVANATVQNANNNSILSFSKTNGNQTLLLENVTFATGGFPVQIDNGAVMDIGETILQGEGAFVMKPYSTLFTGAEAGLDGSIQNTGDQSIDPLAIIGYNGANAQVTGPMLPAEVGQLIIATEKTLTLSNSLTINKSLELRDGDLLLDGNVLAYSDGATLIYSGAQSQNTSDAEFPESNGPANFVVNNEKKLGLHASREVKTLSLSCKIEVDEFVITADSVTNSDDKAFIAAKDGGGLKIRNIGASETFFSVGTTSYAPVWVTNNGTADAVTVSALKDTKKPASGSRVNVLWNIIEDEPGNGDYNLKLGWVRAIENTDFRKTREDDAIIYSMTDTTEIANGADGINLDESPYWVAVNGLEELGTYAVGRFKDETGVKENIIENPVEFALQQNYPNPFNPITTINFSVKKDTKVKLMVYDILGQLVDKVVDKRMNTGSYSIQWDGRNHASGAYIYKLIADDFVQTKKMVLLK